MEPLKIAIVGAGWRAETWMRVIGRLSDRFCLTAVVCRNADRAEKLRSRGVPAVRALSDLRTDELDFALVCVSKAENYTVCRELLSSGAAVLCETPAGTEGEQITAFASLDNEKLQFAEQYPFQPRFQAMRAACEKGMIGEAHTLQISCCHGYHAAALMRSFLQTNSVMPSVRAVRIADEYMQLYSRNGAVPAVQVSCDRVLALAQFERKQALYDFSHPQYFSGIRRPRILLQGTHGEMDFAGGVRVCGNTFASFSFSARYFGTGGDLYAPALDTISCGGEILYKNPFFGISLSDEEIAMAHCLYAMRQFLQTGKPFYGASEAALDAQISAKFASAAEAAL